MKVWIVLIEHDHGNYNIEAIFSTKEAAEAFEAEFPELEETLVEEYEVLKSLTYKMTPN